MAGPGRNAEIMLLNEIVTRVSGGGALTDISNEEVGTLFKRVLAGEVDRQDEFRKSLAELIVSLDPDFLQRSIIESPEVRERLSWAVSRRIINKTLGKLDSNNLDERLSAMEVLQHVGELAVVRHKDSSLRQILSRLCEHLEKFESDPDTCLMLADNIGALLSRVIINGNLKIAIEFLEKMREAGNKMSMHPSRRHFAFRLDAIERLFLRSSSAEAVRYLIRQLGKDKQSLAGRAVKLLEMMRTEEAVVQLLGVFERGARRERHRAFGVLIKMAEVSGNIMSYQLSSLNDREVFPRKHDNPRELIDEAFYRARNSLGVLAEVWHKDAGQIFKSAAHDPDYRIRKEVITVLMNAQRPLLIDIARSLLKDPEEDVRSLAVLAMRNPTGQHVISDLVQLFINEPNLRRQIIETVAGIRDRKSMDFLVQSVVLTDRNLRTIYFQDPTLQTWCVQNLAECGTDRELKAVKAFRDRIQSLYRRFRYFPFRYAIRARRVLLSINASIEEFERNLIEAAATQASGTIEEDEESETDQ
ncbi:MAG TPA: HEAT repeat domain-containing protein, partial [bacterium]|nr:HEAT repeat domain-containing protein [bacterium]